MKTALELAKILLVYVGLLFLTGCSQGLFNPTNTLELNQTYEIPDFGFSLDYPEG